MLRKFFLSVGILFLLFSYAYAKSEGSYYPSRFLVCFRPGVGEVYFVSKGGYVETGFITFDELAQRYGVYQMERWLPNARECDRDGDICLNRIYRLKFNAPLKVEEVVRAFDGDENLLYAEPEGINRLYYTPDDPKYSQQWHLQGNHSVEANKAWDLWLENIGYPVGDSTVIIGIVDSGVDWDHPDLLSNIWQNLGEDADGDGHTIEFIDERWVLDPGDLNGDDADSNGYVDDLIGWDLCGDNIAHPHPDNDPNGPPLRGDLADMLYLMHGTHCAGLASAATDNDEGIASVAWRAKIMPVKCNYDSGSSPRLIYNGYQGILYAAQAGADVISLSWGGGGGQSQCSVVDVASEQYGALVVAAAGNDGTDNDSIPHYPSNCENAISVAGTNRQGRRISWSNYGSTTVDIAAPGGSASLDDILSTAYAEFGDGYCKMSGTSMSAPLAASCFGLLKAFFPDKSNGWLLERMKITCDSVPAPDGKIVGAGKINIFRAIDASIHPHLVYLDYGLGIVDDQNSNGILDPGDTGALRVIVSNQEPWQKAEGIRAILRSDDTRITVADSTAFYGDIIPGSIGINLSDTSAFLFLVSQDLGSGQISFSMTIYANEGSSYPYSDNFSFSVSGVERTPDLAGIPTHFSLSQNYPNPFNPSTQISFTLPRASYVSMKIYNVQGQLVKRLIDNHLGAGSFRVDWDGKDDNGVKVASGIFFYRLSAGKFVQTKRMILLK